MTKRPSVRLLPLALLLLAAGPAGAWAQASPAPAASAPPAAQPAPSAPPPAAPPAPAAEKGCDPASGDICMNQDRLERLGDGHVKATGFVDLQIGDSRIQADELELFQTPKPDGTTARRIKASGNVVFLRGEERLSGDKLDMDLDQGQGTFEHALGFMSPGVIVEADSIERLDANTYRILGGKFTSCTQPNPRWSFSAASAVLETGDEIRARSVVFRVKDVPAFYIPYLIYPIQQDQRSSGILFPHFGQSSTRGFNIGTGFFWAMGRSLDQTFYLDHYSTYGFGFGHEFRYMLPSPSRGTFRSYGFRRKVDGGLDYDLDYTAVQALPHGFKASLLVRQYSNLDFQQQFQDNLDLLSRRTRRSSLNVQRSFGATTVQALADSQETFFGENRRVNRHLPTLRVTQSPQRFKSTGVVYQYEARADGLGLGDETQVQSYFRYDLNPRVSRPFSTSFLQVTPEVQLRYTRYGASVVNDALVTGVPVSRQYLESSLDTRGPTFSRVLNTPGNFYSSAFKHVIGPELTWTYRNAVDDFDAIPKFDGVDYFVGTNELRYALVQRLYAKRPGATGKPEAYEFFNWRLGQTYYANIDASSFDPNYSTAFFDEKGDPAHYSPLQSRMRFRPTPRLTSNFDLEYDVNLRLMRSLSLSANAEYDRFMFQGGWSRSRRAAVNVQNRVLQRDTLRGAARLQILPGRFRVEGSADYDILNKSLVQSTARARYDVQCCGFSVEAIHSDFRQRDERQIRFSIELANIGSIGNFMGQDTQGGLR